MNLTVAMEVHKIKHGKCFPIIVQQYLRAREEKRLKKICNEGGSRSAKTFDAFLFFFWYALYNDGEEKIIRVFRETNVTCMTNTFEADFKTAISLFGIKNEFTLKSGFARCRTTSIYFAGLSSGGEVREPTHSHILFFNEAMENNKFIVDKWVMRCTEMAIFDWNPAATEHWVFDMELEPDCIFTHTTFRDNPNCPPAVVQTILSYEPTEENIRRGTADEYLWQVYGLGLRSTPVGMMYERGFKEYEEIPISKRKVRKNYTDTADTGEDFLCSVCYVETEDHCYVTDVLYTNKPMEYGESATARMLIANSTEYAEIESNNGGRGFARNVESLVNAEGHAEITISSFYQGLNKQTRIFTNSNKVQNLILFPKGWKEKWPDFARSLLGFKKEGKNAHDDAPDVITGIAEKFQVIRLFNETDTLYYDTLPMCDNCIGIIVKDERNLNRFCSAIYGTHGGNVYVMDVLYFEAEYEVACDKIVGQINRFNPMFVNVYAEREWRNYIEQMQSVISTNIGRSEKRFSETEYVTAKCGLIVEHFRYKSQKDAKEYTDFLKDKHNYVIGGKEQPNVGILCDAIAAHYYNTTGVI